MVMIITTAFTSKGCCAISMREPCEALGSCDLEGEARQGESRDPGIQLELKSTSASCL